MVKRYQDFCAEFGIDVPIFGFSHSVETVAAITNAGGFGVYGATRRFDHEITSELAQIRDMTGDRPYGVDLVIPARIPAENNRAAMEKDVPQEHRDFINGMISKYDVPEPSGRENAPGSSDRRKLSALRSRLSKTPT